MRICAYTQALAHTHTRTPRYPGILQVKIVILIPFVYAVNDNLKVFVLGRGITSGECLQRPDVKLWPLNVANYN